MAPKENKPQPQSPIDGASIIGDAIERVLNAGLNPLTMIGILSLIKGDLENSIRKG